MGQMGLIVVGVFMAALLALWLIGERGRLLRTSTWRIIRENGARPFLNLRAPHGYVYARWPKQCFRVFFYHIFRKMGPRAKRWFANGYHGKVLTHEHARAMLTVNREIPLRDLEQVIPYPMARKLLLGGPPDVVAFECPCRRARPHPCHPTQVCLIVGQPFVDFVLEHHPTESRRLTQAEALDIIEAEHRRGHVHTAWFKDACLDRFFALCNCCKCCCGGIDAMVNHGIPLMASSGYVAQVDAARCNGCCECEEVCPFGAIQLGDKATIAWETCLGCGACLARCPEGALSLERDPRKGIPLDVRLLDEGPE